MSKAYDPRPLICVYCNRAYMTWNGLLRCHRKHETYGTSSCTAEELGRCGR